MSDALRAMNCTTCGGSLPALAGHKAKALVCSYCGSVMDRHDGYKVLAQYRDMRRPDGPFKLGDEGEILGVSQTIVGIVGVVTRIDGIDYRWTDYQLYAPTHGYSWLTWNNGHLTHSRKVRDGTDHSETRRSFAPKAQKEAAGRTFQMFEAYQATIEYIEGELTWIPKLGNEIRVVESIAPPLGFAVAYNEREIETELQTYLDRGAVLESFGFADDLPKPEGVHAIQPFEAPILKPLGKAAGYFLPIALVGALGLYAFGGGSTVAQARIDNPATGGELDFTAPSTGRLMAINMMAGLSNQWAAYDMTLVHKESGEEIEFGKDLAYYSGYDDGAWSEGSRKATLRFKPPLEGDYTLRIASAALDPNEPMNAIDRKQFAKDIPITVEIRKNVMVSRYFWILAFISLACYLALIFKRGTFEAARWGGEGEDDDD